MRSPRQLLSTGAVVAGLAIGAAVGPTAAASAATTVNTFQIPLLTPNKIWLCGISPLCASNLVAITGEVPGTVTFPALMPGATGSYWMHWRNLGTGASGVRTISYSEAVSVFTGAGLVIASMTTGDEAIAGTGVFPVP